MSRSSSSSVLCVLLVVCAFGPARADDPEEALRRHLGQAQTTYGRGAYEESLRELQEAYTIRPLPRLLLNIGLAQRKLGRDQAALATFERYLSDEPNPPADVASDLTEYMARVRAAAAAPAPPVAPPTPTPRAAPASVPASTADTDRRSAAPRPVPLYRRWWLWSIVGVAAAGTIAAIAAGVTAPRTAGSYPNARDLDF